MRVIVHSVNVHAIPGRSIHQTYCSPSGRMQSSQELEKLQTKIEELEGQIKKSQDLAERTTMRNLLLTLEQRVNFLMQSEEA